MKSPELNFEPIQEATVEDHEKLLSNRILSIQLRYAERISSGEIPFVDGKFKQMDLAQATATYTWIPKRIRHAYAKRIGIAMSGRELESYLDNNDEFTNIFHEIMDDISKEHELALDADVLASRSEEIITNVIERLPQAERKGGATNEWLGREDAGSIMYKVTKDMKGLEEYGISPDDLCVDVHFEAMYRRKLNQENKKLRRADIEDSFRQIAKNIKEKDQDVKAIVGSSWLLDSKVATALGFCGLHPFRREGFSQGDGFWGQFIDISGQIKQDEVDKFLQTGKPKYKLMVGYIPINKFIEKYGE